MIQRIERIFIVVILLFFCVKAFLHWVVSPVLIVLLSTFSIYSAVMGVVLFNGIQELSQKSFSTIKQWRIPVAIFLGVGASVITTGFEFKILFWVGASTMLMIGIGTLFLGLLLSAYFLFLKKDASFKSMFVRAFAGVLSRFSFCCCPIIH